MILRSPTISSLSGVLTVAIVVACGSEVQVPDAASSSGQGGDYVFIAGSGGTGASPPQPPPPPPPVPPPYDDPGCPDAPPPLEDYTCDPFALDGGGCLAGEACQIYVQYPSEPCGQEIYGSACVPAGTGVQGEGCMGGQDCGAGFVCVITGSGTQCVQLCKLDGPSGCPSGLVCEPIDVKGFGGCL
ncbi:MAG: hypothetical protein FJ096_10350 [Deltaproteobacteria bacterium]|nr:hypothetical protein [Deltaproteobacteria bacterium]